MRRSHNATLFALATALMRGSSSVLRPELGVEISPENVHIAESAPLILPLHRELDLLREKALGKAKIGTTGRGIGPAYEDKAARRAIRVGDLAEPEVLSDRVEGLLLHHNALRRGLGEAEIEAGELLAKLQDVAPKILPYAGVVWQELDTARSHGKRILFEGAQGTMLDVDHGTYPFVTSSNTVAAAASTGTGVGPRHLDYILGIVKAYTTRVGAGPFPTELFDDQGAHLARVGAEFGATTGRPRRCGWLDAVALRRSIINSSVSGLCITKLDVLDEFETIQICIGYEIDGETIASMPVVVDRLAECKPLYEEWPGWQQSTVGVTNDADLPQAARNYLARIEELAGVPIDIISTGPDREQTIVKTHPFG